MEGSSIEGPFSKNKNFIDFERSHVATRSFSHLS
jgi:hypothetical protein